MRINKRTLVKLRRLYRKFMHIQRCSVCKKMVRLRWEKLWITHPDEPPLFGYYYCPECGSESNVIESKISIDAARSLGYTSGLEIILETAKKLKEQNNG